MSMIPGMYALISMLFDKRTRAYLRNAELGFLGVIVPTRVHTPRFCGEFKSVNFLFTVETFILKLENLIF